MCYYNGQKVTRAEYIRLKELEKLTADFDFLNRVIEVGFDYNTAAVLKPIPGKNDFEIVQMEWGLLPFFKKTRHEVTLFRTGHKDHNTGKYQPAIITLNAIGEELFDKVMYKEAAMKRRCLVLSSGFYEWRHIFPIGKRTGQPLKTATKYPYHIYLPEQEYFFMAGIWSPWTDKETGEYVESFSIVTTKANSLMEQVHNSKKRMPTILNEDLAYEWLFGTLDEKRIIEIATTQFPANKMKAYPLTKDFFQSNDPLKKHVYEELPALL